ncbi:kinase-like domain-containing protein, partial [Pavlovales sp. CCMP2436]
MGKRQYVVKGTTFDVDERYQVKKGVGQGAYGLICAAKDTVSGESVAVKKINNAFEDAVDCKRILRELKLLRHFNHENVLGLRDIMSPPPGKPETWKDMYLVTELLDTDLHYIIHSKQALTDDHIQYFVYQILRGLKCIHAARVLHRDLKPGNLLVNKNCDLKICDFGLARGVDHDAHQNKLTEYVVTRWYRAPELLVEAEFLGRKALFPGRDYLQQLRLIIDVLGTPTTSDLAIIQNEQAVEYIKSLPKREKASFKKMFPNSNQQAVELLEK